MQCYAQLSPGELTKSHAELEGIGNCTKCHDLGKAVSSTKCLECHKEIRSLVDEDRGFHASAEVVEKECFECHSDHHGRKFDMVRFDKDNFDHDNTGYKLEGKHEVTDCRECHKTEYISDLNIRKLDGTFLGLGQECLDCHDDFHQKTLSENCASCHNIEDFRPAPGFDHDDADYQLREKHLEVECKECHPTITKNNKDFQVFTDIAFDDCIACHEDSHEGHFTGACTQCHLEYSFSDFSGNRKFNHNTTNFALKGSHQSVDCFECHLSTSDPLLVFQDHIGVAETSCIECHDDVHDNKFGNDCAKCHNEESWLLLNSMDQFDHNLTDYPLEGMHVDVDCKECHTNERYTQPIDFSACMNCHEDYHEGEFAENGLSPDCVECHVLKKGFEETLYTVEQHNKTVFPLEGAHVATPCFACHVSEESRWNFRDIGSDCSHCHEDVHNEAFALNNVTDCARCHNSETWSPNGFDHDQTAFPLDGRHETVACEGCHKPYEENGKFFVQYKIDKFECVDCHQ